MAETREPEGDKKNRTDRRVPAPIVIAIVLPVFAMLLLLGNWQLQRLAWKEGLLATIETRIRQAPEPLDAVVTAWQRDGDVDYLPVTFEGRFMHDREQHFLATLDGQSGWYVYTPMQLSDGRKIIVNRGFVPYDLKDPAERGWQPVAGPVTIVGLARNPLDRKPGSLVPDNAPAERTWYWKDHAAMAQAMALAEDPLVPFFVDVASTDGEVAAGPVGGVTRVALPNNHLQYAVTWFGLAAALAVVAGAFLWHRN